MSAPSTLVYFSSEAGKKQHTLKHNLGQYLLSSGLAGALIAIVLTVSLKLGQTLFDPGKDTYFIAVAGFFGVALACIIFCKLELFTSNVMYFAVGCLSKTCKPSALIYSWIVVYIGNLIGVLLFVLIYAGAGGMGHLAPNHVLFQIVNHKIHASTWEIFFKGILCNWIICLAVWVPMRLQNEAARLFMILFLVFVFFFSGFEHSVANMAFFALAILENMPALSAHDILHNMLPATLGNIVGGAILVGAIMFYLEKHTLTNNESLYQ